MAIRRPGQIFENPSSTLHDLFVKSRDHQQIQALIHRYFPPSAAPADASSMTSRPSITGAASTTRATSSNASDWTALTRPPGSPDAVDAGSFKDGVLTLIVTDAATATRLRYSLRQLQQALASEKLLRGLHQIKLQVRPPKGSPRPHQPVFNRTLSRENAEHISATAEYIEDAELRQALNRLAQHGSDESE